MGCRRKQLWRSDLNRLRLGVRDKAPSNVARQANAKPQAANQEDANVSAPAMLFQNLRWRLFHNPLSLLMAHSWLRVYTIAVCCAVIWTFLFTLSWYGFHELSTRPDWRIRLDGTLI